MSDFPKQENTEKQERSFAVAADLLQEVCDAHADPESPEFNDCGTPENDCEWCRMAKQWISAQNTVSVGCGSVFSVSGTELDVCRDIELRQQMGIQKYGMTVATNPAHLIEWLRHAYEESIDRAIYLKRAIAELDSANAKADS